MFHREKKSFKHYFSMVEPRHKCQNPRVLSPEPLFKPFHLHRKRPEKQIMVWEEILHPSDRLMQMSRRDLFFIPPQCLVLCHIICLSGR